MGVGVGIGVELTLCFFCEGEREGSCFTRRMEHARNEITGLGVRVRVMVRVRVRVMH
jgi:hypothetical protein